MENCFKSKDIIKSARNISSISQRLVANKRVIVLRDMWIQKDINFNSKSLQHLSWITCIAYNTATSNGFSLKSKSLWIDKSLVRSLEMKR